MNAAPATKLGLVQRVAVGLELFLGVGAVLGGAALILAPDGALLGLPLRVLDASPFRSFLWPGVLLFTVIGVVPIIVAVLTLQRNPIAALAAVFVGGAVVVWIAVEMVMLSGASSLVWAFYLVLGTSIAALGVSWFRSTHPGHRHVV